MEKENYEAYLKSQDWKKRRKEFFSKSCGRCYVCGKKGLMQVHHKTYYRNGISVLHNEQAQDLLLLCETCHHKIHQYNIEGYLREALPDNLKKIKIASEIQRRDALKDKPNVTVYPPAKRKPFKRKERKYQYKKYRGIFNRDES